MGMVHSFHTRKRAFQLVSAAMALGAYSSAAPADAQETSTAIPHHPLERRAYGPDQVWEPSYGELIPMRAPYQHNEARRALSAMGDQPPRASWAHPRMLIFAGGGDEALTWSPRQSGSEARFSYRDDRVELGDVHAGLGLEASGATLAIGYVEKSYETGVGSNRESFAGVTVTWRR